MNTSFLLHHTVAHKKSVEEDTRDPQRYLRKVEHDAGLIDEIDTLGSS